MKNAKDKTDKKELFQEKWEVWSKGSDHTWEEIPADYKHKSVSVEVEAPKSKKKD